MYPKAKLVTGIIVKGNIQFGIEISVPVKGVPHGQSVKVHIGAHPEGAIGLSKKVKASMFETVSSNAKVINGLVIVFNGKVQPEF